MMNYTVRLNGMICREKQAAAGPGSGAPLLCDLLQPFVIVYRESLPREIEDSQAPEFVEHRSNGLAGAACEKCDIGMRNVRFDKDGLLFDFPEFFGMPHQEAGNTAADILEQQILQSVLDFTEPVADAVSDIRAEFGMFIEDMIECFALYGINLDIVERLRYLAYIVEIVDKAQFADDFAGADDIENHLGAVRRDAGYFDMPGFDKKQCRRLPSRKLDHVVFPEVVKYYRFVDRFDNFIFYTVEYGKLPQLVLMYRVHLECPSVKVKRPRLWSTFVGRERQGSPYTITELS